jgi:hypothetical protein
MFQTRTEDREREEEFKNYINNKEDKKCLRANNK